MGYTHYWKTTQPMTAYEWADICKSAITYCTRSSVPVHIETSMHMPAPYGKETKRIQSQIKIEGIGEAGYETFLLYPYEYVGDFACCKTGRRPYDEIIVAVLNRAAERCPEKFFWKSDGDWNDHEAGLTLQYSQPANPRTTAYYCVTY